MVPAVPGGGIPVGHEHLRPFLLEARPQKLQSQRANAENQLEGEREFPWRDQVLGIKGTWFKRVGEESWWSRFAPPLFQLKAAGGFWAGCVSAAVAKLGVSQQQIWVGEGMGTPPTPVSSLQNRVGAVSQLRYEPGRVLCDVHCCDGMVMAG